MLLNKQAWDPFTSKDFKLQESILKNVEMTFPFVTSENNVCTCFFQLLDSLKLFQKNNFFIKV